jgi:hypothetical protein
LSGALGELPAGGLVSVWVADGDVPRAREVIAADAAANAQPLDDAEEGAESLVPRAAPRSRGGFAPVVTALVVGAVIGLVVGAVQWRPAPATDSLDFDGDGLADQFEDYAGDRLVRIRTDRNGDGAIDEITDRPGTRATRVALDDDFDGRFESTLQYARGNLAAWESDLDGDGHAEWRHDFQHGVLLTSVYQLPGAARPLKRVTFDAGQRVLEEFDADGDGTLETVRHYDARDERVP